MSRDVIGKRMQMPLLYIKNMSQSVAKSLRNATAFAKQIVSRLPKHLIILRNSPYYIKYLFLGCVFVIICAIIIHFTNEDVAKFVDPILSIFSSVILIILSFPYRK